MARLRKPFFKFLRILLILILIYLSLAYVILPAAWKHYEYHVSLGNAPKTTQKSFGKPGDPLNVALVGTEEEFIQAMAAAGWSLAEPRNVLSELKIFEREILKRRYPRAPVSNLYLFGRKQDLAFERPVGKSPRQRHHARFWRADQYGLNGKPLWLGAATFDRSIGLSRITGEITHHIAPDVDAERETLMNDLEKAGQLVQTYQVTGIGPTFRATNGEGDWFYTDGEMTVSVLSADNKVQDQPPPALPSPARIRLKNGIWTHLRGLLKFFERF